MKTALFGHNSNGGRIAQAAGMALAGEDLEELQPNRSSPANLASDMPEADPLRQPRPRHGRGPRLLQRPDSRLHPDQRGVHDVTPRAARATCRWAPVIRPACTTKVKLARFMNGRSGFERVSGCSCWWTTQDGSPALKPAGAPDPRCSTKPPVRRCCSSSRRSRPGRS